MKNAALLLCAATALAGCADAANTAIFVTSSSLGINMDSKPPTVAVAYERVEGFLGPRSENGGAPPVVASMETDGNIFAPQIKQTYATGAAAVTAAQGEKEGGPKTLEGPRRPMFFGTGTTLGFKVGFGPEGAPDSLVLGYKRKEISIIPLGVKKEEGKPDQAVYPSVLASIDTTSKMTSQATSGLATKQFFATGRAADALANNKTITAAFREKSQESLLDSLPKEQRDAAKVAAGRLADERDKQLDFILSTISCNDGQTLNPELRNRLIADTRGAPAKLRNATTPAQFRKDLEDIPGIVPRLHAVAKEEGRPKCP